MTYFDLKHVPKNEVVATFELTPCNKGVASKVALESSVGTWTGVKGTVEKLKAKVFYMKKGFIKIGYPVELFEKGNLPQLLSSVAGNIFGMKVLNSLKLVNLDFPKGYVQFFKGPAFGLQGVLEYYGISERPVLGTIVKPKIGLNERNHAKRAYESWIGGMDFVKDDENLTSMRFNNFEKRVVEVLKIQKKAERETGSKKLYAFNVTASVSEMIERAKFVKKNGGRCVMIDVLTAGIGAVQELRNANLGLIIHAHRAMHAAIGRGSFGIDFLVWCKLLRLAGVDQLHAGTVVGKMKGDRQDVFGCYNFLRKKWLSIKPVMPVASGGLHPGHVPFLVENFGIEVVFQFGGGVHGHPFGTVSGSRAVVQAVQASINRVRLKNYAEKHEELKQALKKWSR
ncbi:MAG: ribulose-bisphosphate carboxylase large subunit [Nanoarchaeota archaeon]|nr:ribulose-bisphosphate carboxylase large subunit [Nanoarchaeota archaeon]